MSPNGPDLSPEEAQLAEVLTLAETASILRISVTQARRLAAKGELPGALPKIGTHQLVSKPALFEFLAHANGGHRDG